MGVGMAGYENDIFISYSQEDNQPNSDESIFEWVTEFHHDLAARLAKYMGEPPRIWRDNRGQESFEGSKAETRDRLSKSAIMLSIFSSGYLRSEWCERELKAFTRYAKKNGGIKIKNKFRIFKIIKTPLAAHEKFPAQVRDATGYAFYKVDDNDRVREFDKSIYPEAKREYYLALDDLAQDVYQLLMAIKTEGVGRAEPIDNEERPMDDSKPTVYVSLPPTDLKAYHQQIKRELQARGYEVVPQQEFHGSMAERATAIKEYLQQAELSVHFFGGVFDRMARLQNDLAAERSVEGGLQRLIWIPRSILDRVNSGEPQAEAAQSEFLEQLQLDERMQAGAELVSESLDQLITDMLRRLAPKSTAQAPQSLAGDLPCVYVIDTQISAPALKWLRGQLMALGVELRLARQEKDQILMPLVTESNATKS
ncbi:MAG TPA: hypothetical protein DCE41_11820 [Cytophagales bacterium]|nr:hypothetical protein [Cytophagales bacterium]